MDKKYVVTVKKPKNAEKYQCREFWTHRIVLAKTIIESSSPKKSFIDMFVDAAKQFQSKPDITIHNQATWYQRRFSNISEFVSWARKLPMDKLCEIAFSFEIPPISKDLLSSSITFFVDEYIHSGKSAEPKLWKLEIKDFLTDEPIHEKDYSNFKKVDDYVQSLIDPSHKKFLPNSPCINRDCKFLVNGCDITDYFLETNDMDINFYKIDDAQVFECTEYRRKSTTTIHHVLAIEEHNPMPRLVYSSVKEVLDDKVRERGISEGVTWDSEHNKPMDNLYYQISAFGPNDNRLSEFKRYLKRYSNGRPVTSFVCIEFKYFFGAHTTEMREYYIDDSIFGFGQSVSSAAPEGDYSHLIPPHEKWNYDDFDVIL